MTGRSVRAQRTARRGPARPCAAHDAVTRYKQTSHRLPAAFLPNGSTRTAPGAGAARRKAAAALTARKAQAGLTATRGHARPRAAPPAVPSAPRARRPAPLSAPLLTCRLIARLPGAAVKQRGGVS